MPIRIIYFVHGTTTDNEQGISSGWKNADLSEAGIRQSIDLRKNVADINFDIVFCSDLVRAVNSAKLIFEDRVIIDKDARLRECNYGIYNGQPSSLVEPMQERNVENKFSEGESYVDVKNRINDFLNFLRHHHDGKTVGIVAHKALQLALDVLLKQKTWEQSFAEDWRKTKSWQPGWEYNLK